MNSYNIWTHTQVVCKHNAIYIRKFEYIQFQVWEPALSGSWLFTLFVLKQNPKAKPKQTNKKTEQQQKTYLGGTLRRPLGYTVCFPYKEIEQATELTEEMGLNHHLWAFSSALVACVGLWEQLKLGMLLSSPALCLQHKIALRWRDR